MSKKQAAAKREVLIIARYSIKKNYTTTDGRTFLAGSIVLLVRNDQGVEYTVTLRRNGQHSCSCPARSHHCYHLDHCRAIENARVARENAATRARLAEQELEQIAAEALAERDLATLGRQLAPTPAPTAVDLATRGSLTRQAGFSLMR